jgi:hypothetical protein
LGDFNPKTLVAVGFKLAYRPENYFGVFNCVFHLNIGALNGDWIDYELWILTCYGNPSKNPTVDELYEVFENSAKIFKSMLTEEAKLNGCILTNIPHLK